MASILAYHPDFKGFFIEIGDNPENPIHNSQKRIKPSELEHFGSETINAGHDEKSRHDLSEKTLIRYRRLAIDLAERIGANYVFLETPRELLSGTAFSEFGGLATFYRRKQ